MKIKIIISFLIPTLFLVSCGGIEEILPQKKYIWPLENGNYWKYRVKFRDEPNKLFYTYYKVLRDTLLYDNELWKVVEYDSNATSIIIIRNKENGLWAHKLQVTITKDSAFLMYKYPAEVNDTYPNLNDNTNTSVVSLNEKVVVPAGTFYCLHYLKKVANQKSEFHFYFAPAVGYIKNEYFYADSMGTLFLNNRLELIEYKLMK